MQSVKFRHNICYMTSNIPLPLNGITQSCGKVNFVEEHVGGQATYDAVVS